MRSVTIELVSNILYKFRPNSVTWQRDVTEEEWQFECNASSQDAADGDCVTVACVLR